MEQSEIMRDMDSSQQIDSYIPHKNFVCRGYNKQEFDMTDNRQITPALASHEHVWNSKRYSIPIFPVLNWMFVDLTIPKADRLTSECGYLPSTSVFWSSCPSPTLTTACLWHLTRLWVTNLIMSKFLFKSCKIPWNRLWIKHYKKQTNLPALRLDCQVKISSNTLHTVVFKLNKLRQMSMKRTLVERANNVLYNHLNVATKNALG